MTLRYLSFCSQAYDNQISQLKVELQKEMEHEPVKATVKPQIKQPKVSPPKALKKAEVTPPKQKTETDSSGADSTQVSPSVQEDKGKIATAYCIYPAISWSFPLSRMITNNKSSPMQFRYKQLLPFLNDPKNRDPSYKTDLDFWDCFEGKKFSVL